MCVAKRVAACRSLARQSASRPAPARRRSGLTMLELLLVLALIVAVGAAAMPAFFGPLENYRLRKSAELVRTQWEKLRIQAMRSGQTMMFRFQVGGNRAQGGPWNTGEDMLEGSPFAGGGMMMNPAAAMPAAGGMGLPGGSTYQLEEELPDQVMFVGVEAAASMRDAMIQQTAAAMAGPNQLPEDQAWSPPILFYPDGTSSTVRLLLQNKQQTFIMIRLRGLTGVAEISDLMSAEELPP
jgi:hypothetical protein